MVEVPVHLLDEVILFLKASFLSIYKIFLLRVKFKSDTKKFEVHIYNPGFLLKNIGKNKWFSLLMLIWMLPDKDGNRGSSSIQRALVCSSKRWPQVYDQRWNFKLYIILHYVIINNIVTVNIPSRDKLVIKLINLPQVKLSN